MTKQEVITELISDGDKKLLKNLQGRERHHDERVMKLDLEIVSLKDDLKEFKKYYDLAAKRAKRYKDKLKLIKEII